MIPLLCAPQQSHVRMDLASPVEVSSKSPQSVQNTRVPITDILCKDSVVLSLRVCRWQLMDDVVGRKK